MKQRLMWIAWPSFLMAATLELVVFAFVDPQDLHWLHATTEISRQAAYTAGFFLFWTATALSGALTTLLSMSPFEVNRCPMPACERPETCKVLNEHL
jgi:hypothetical protein